MDAVMLTEPAAGRNGLLLRRPKNQNRLKPQRSPRSIAILPVVFGAALRHIMRQTGGNDPRDTCHFPLQKMPSIHFN